MFEKRGSWCCSRSCPSKNKNFKAVIIEPFRFEANLRFKNYSLVLKIPKQQKQILPIGNERTIGSIRASSSNSYIVMDLTIVGFCTLAVSTKTLISLLLSSISDSAALHDWIYPYSSTDIP